MRQTIGVLVLAASVTPLLAQQAAERRRHDLEVLQKVLQPSSTKFTGRINATDRSWEDWVRRTGELPPDFASMPSIPPCPKWTSAASDSPATPATETRPWWPPPSTSASAP
jgi:hypothetical protein